MPDDSPDQAPKDTAGIPGPGPEATPTPPPVELGPGPVATGPVPEAPAAPAAPVPLEVPLESQISSLPALEYPGSVNEDLRRLAAEKRRGRLRLEIGGGAVILLLGLAATIMTGRTALLVIALFAVVGLAVYEFLVDSFQ